MKKPMMVGLGLSAIAVLGMTATLAFRGTAQSPEDLAGLSDQEKLEILNSSDEKAIIELMEAEESLRRAMFERQRLEAEKIRADSKIRGETYWAEFDSADIDLMGLNFELITTVSPLDRTERFLAAIPGITRFERATEITYPAEITDCGEDKYTASDKYLDTAPALPLKHSEFDMPRLHDYLADRAALQTGDCSCATQIVPPEQAYQLLQRIMAVSGLETLRASQQEDAIARTVSVFWHSLEKEKQAFCNAGQ